MMLHVAKRFPERMAGMIGAAPSFFKSFNNLKTHSGAYTLPSRCAQGGAYELPPSFVEGVRNFDLFPTPESLYPLPCKLYVLHGMRDTSVPWTDSLDFVRSRIGESQHEVNLVLSKLGQHRLSEDDDISMLLDLVERMVRK